MEANVTLTVHRVTISRSAGSARPIVYTAKCFVCGLILERNEGRLIICVPGLYAVSGEEENFRVQRIEGAFPPGMMLCRDSDGLSR